MSLKILKEKAYKISFNCIYGQERLGRPAFSTHLSIYVRFSRYDTEKGHSSPGSNK